jgi:hypothetical protein
MSDYQGILFFGQSLEMAGRGISGFRLRTAAARAGFNILIIDYVGDLNTDQIVQIIEKHNTGSLKFLGFSTSWIENTNKNAFKWYNYEFFKLVKEKFSNLLLISGGHDVVNRRELLHYSDYHFHGYSDNTFVEFLKLINNQSYNLTLSENKTLFNGKFIDSNKTNPVGDPDEIETVLLPEDNFLSFQPVPIEISRGCIFRCSFCRHPFQGKKEYDSYQRTPESIARELARNYELFGTTRYTVMDDTFNDSIEKLDRLKKAIEIAKLPDFQFVAYIRPELLVTKPEMIPMLTDMGLRGAFFGVESFNATARKSIGKGIDVQRVIDAGYKLADAGALIHASLIVGLPGESKEEIIEAQKYLIGGKSPFRSWIWQALGIRNEGINVAEAKSMFDKRPEDYGYTIPLNSNQWKNEHFTFVSATELTKKLNEHSNNYMKFAGWKVAGAWHLDKSDEVIENEVIDSKKFYTELKILSAKRVNVELQRLGIGNA